MNLKVWTEQEGADWERKVAEMGQLVRKYVRVQLFCALMILICGLFTPTLVCIGDYWMALAQAALTWMMYWLYRNIRRYACLWRTCYHHGQRSLVEEGDRSTWHLNQLAITLGQIR